MKTLLLGSDFMYNSTGNLIPIEINTNVGLDMTPVEDYDDILSLTELSSFIIDNKFTKVTYIGSIGFFSEKFQELCVNINIEYSYIDMVFGSLTVPDVVDSDEHLIIRSSYDVTAVVDEKYCKNKINFLNLIKDEPVGTEFAYMDEAGTLVNNITSILDNGNQPNFILKSVLPLYDKDIYPKLYKVSNQAELEIGRAHV